MKDIMIVHLRRSSKTNTTQTSLGGGVFTMKIKDKILYLSDEDFEDINKRLDFFGTYFPSNKKKSIY